MLQKYIKTIELQNIFNKNILSAQNKYIILRYGRNNGQNN